MGQEILERRHWRRVTVVSGSRPERKRSDKAKDKLGGTWPQGVPAMTVPGQVLAARAMSLDLSRLRKAGFPVWLSLLGMSLCDASSGASHPPQFLSGFDGDLVSIVASSKGALRSHRCHQHHR
ncbi:hypothetical protein HPB50_019681 [Hyalomma asiaticum]|uniref:Uncharacterized protein n=1 Tax=Hyalomma asiaticum TaxID=266040 RepID=A0ACB7TK47_HYAAI|nr:hypothetical protein HPB50_019681 [Hyalomma asiaticum]